MLAFVQVERKKTTFYIIRRRAKKKFYQNHSHVLAGINQLSWNAYSMSDEKLDPQRSPELTGKGIPQFRMSVQVAPNHITAVL